MKKAVFQATSPRKGVGAYPHCGVQKTTNKPRVEYPGVLRLTCACTPRSSRVGTRGVDQPLFVCCGKWRPNPA
eukprot:6434704-Prymnesium_polylepis.1